MTSAEIRCVKACPYCRFPMVCSIGFAFASDCNGILGYMIPVLAMLHFARIAPSKLDARKMEDSPKMSVELRRSRLIFGAGAIALCIASILAIAAAITCHMAGAELARGLSWVPSLLYGAILWLWWAGVAYLIWSAGRRNPMFFRVSVSSLLLQIFLGIITSASHLGSLHFTTRFMGRLWPEWHIARFDALTFFEIGAQNSECGSLFNARDLLTCHTIHDGLTKRSTFAHYLQVASSGKLRIICGLNSGLPAFR